RVLDSNRSISSAYSLRISSTNCITCSKVSLPAPLPACCAGLSATGFSHTISTSMQDFAVRAIRGHPMQTHAITADPLYEFAADVRAGLTEPRQKELPSKYL